MIFRISISLGNALLVVTRDCTQIQLSISHSYSRDIKYMYVIYHALAHYQDVRNKTFENKKGNLKSCLDLAPHLKK